MATKKDVSFAYKVGKDIANLENAVRELSENKSSGGILTQKISVDKSKIPAFIVDNNDYARQALSNLKVKANAELAGKIGFIFGAGERFPGNLIPSEFTVSFENVDDSVLLVALDVDVSETLAEIDNQAIENVKTEIANNWLYQAKDRKLQHYLDVLEHTYGWHNASRWEVEEGLNNNGEARGSGSAEFKRNNPGVFEELAKQYVQDIKDIEHKYDRYQAGEIGFDELISK